MKKVTLVIAGVLLAGGIFYLSRTGTLNPPAEHVAGAIGGKRLPLGSTVCVNKLSNKSERTQASMEGVEELLVTRLNNTGFRGRLLSGPGSTDSPSAKADCDATVYGEIIALKGKNRVEAEVEFRLMITGDQTPYLSSSAKGKSPERPSAAESRDMVKAVAPGANLKLDEAASLAAATRDALGTAFASVARKIEQQQDPRSERASVE